MRHQRLRSVVVDGFTSIRSAELALNDVNVLVGANGAGKSNLIRALGVLGRIVDGELGLYVGLSGGASALLNANPAEPRRVRLKVESDAGGYSAELTPAAGDTLIFSKESFLPQGWDTAESLGRGHRESTLAALAAPGTLYGAEAGALVETLQGCRVFHFHDTSRDAPVKQQGYTADNRSLHSDAGNLAAVLLRLHDGDRGRYQRIVRTVKQVAPFFRDFALEPELAPDRVRLRWQQEGSDTVLPADALSDGTLRFICLAALLGQPELPGLIILDEPGKPGPARHPVSHPDEPVRTRRPHRRGTPRRCLGLRAAGSGPPQRMARGVLAWRAVGEEPPRRASPAGARLTVRHLHILCEGQTEEMITSDVLVSYFAGADAYVTWSVLTTKRPAGGPAFKGGVSTWPKLERELRLLLHDNSTTVLTTLREWWTARTGRLTTVFATSSQRWPRR
jgi:predicted ATPase